MYSKRQINRARKSVVHLIKEVDKRIHFNVVYIDSKQNRKEHYVIFVKNKPFLESFNCDCYWCSFYGRDKKTKKLIKLCANSLAVGKYMRIPYIEQLFKEYI